MPVQPGRKKKKGAQAVGSPRAAKKGPPGSQEGDKFATLFRSMRQGVFYQAADGGLIDVNPAALKMFGVTRRELLSRDSLHPAWHIVREDGTPLPGPKHPSMVALKTGKPIKDFVLGLENNKSGKTVWLAVNAIPEFRRGEKKPYRVAVTLHDLTEAKRAEKDLRESRNRFQGLFQNIREAVAVYEAVDDGRDFIFRDFNPAAEAIENVRRENLIGRRVTEVFPGVEEFGLLDVLRRVWASGKTESFPAHIYKDARGPGTWRENEVYKIPGGEVVAVYRDVTEQKRTEAALRESEDKFKYVFDHSIIGKSFTLPNGEIQVNAAFGRMLGYSPEELGHTKWQDISHPEDIEATQKIIDDLISGRADSARFKKRYLRRTGEIVWADVSTSLRRGPEGRPLYFITSVSDINEQVRAEEAMRESEQRFHGLFTSMREMVVLHEEVLDARGAIVDYRIFDCNPAFTAATGISREEARGRLASELYGSGEPPYLETYAEVLLTGRPSAFETFFPPLNKYFHVSAFRLSPGRFATVTMDITQRVRMENALREDEERYRSLFESANDGIHLLRGGIFVDCNQRAVEQFGCADKSEVVGRIPSGFSPDRQADGQASDQKAAAYIAAAELGTPQRFQWRHLRTDGSTFEAEVSLNGLILGGQTYLLAIVRNITDRVRAEEEIRRSLREKETLLREIYHRTKNNMNVIASMLSLRARATAEPAAAEVCRDVQDRIRSMALVHQKLYESRDLSSIDLKDYFEALASNLVKSHGEQAAGLRIVPDLEPVVVPIDIAIPCGMILNELFSNAFKHAFPGGREGTIRLRLKRAGRDDIEIVFSDDGDRVPGGFDPRARAGLGLRTLFMLVEHQLQGSVAFEVQAGLTCRIRFAAQPPGTETPA